MKTQKGWKGVITSTEAEEARLPEGQHKIRDNPKLNQDQTLTKQRGKKLGLKQDQTWADKELYIDKIKHQKPDVN